MTKSIELIFLLCMKKLICLLLLFIGSTAWAASPLIFQPQTTPLTPPETGEAAVQSAPTAPAPEYPVYEREKGLFGRSLDARLSGLYLYNRTGQQGLFGLVGGACTFILRDPYQLGKYLGLAEDALEYEIGPGLVLGNGINSQAFFSLPLNLGATLYLKENSLWGGTPFISLKMAFNLFGTENKIGGLGFQLYGGTENDLGLFGEKTGLIVGWGSYRITDSLFAEGLILSVSQPVRL